MENWRYANYTGTVFINDPSNNLLIQRENAEIESFETVLSNGTLGRILTTNITQLLQSLPPQYASHILEIQAFPGVSSGSQSLGSVEKLTKDMHVQIYSRTNYSNVFDCYFRLIKEEEPGPITDLDIKEKSRVDAEITVDKERKPSIDTRQRRFRCYSETRVPFDDEVGKTLKQQLSDQYISKADYFCSKLFTPGYSMTKHDVVVSDISESIYSDSVGKNPTTTTTTNATTENSLSDSCESLDSLAEKVSKHEVLKSNLETNNIPSERTTKIKAKQLKAGLELAPPPDILSPRVSKWDEKYQSKTKDLLGSFINEIHKERIYFSDFASKLSMISTNGLEGVAEENEDEGMETDAEAHYQETGQSGGSTRSAHIHKSGYLQANTREDEKEVSIDEYADNDESTSNYFETTTAGESETIRSNTEEDATNEIQEGSCSLESGCSKKEGSSSSPIEIEYFPYEKAEHEKLEFPIHKTNLKKRVSRKIETKIIPKDQPKEKKNSKSNLSKSRKPSIKPDPIIPTFAFTTSSASLDASTLSLLSLGSNKYSISNLNSKPISAFSSTNTSINIEEQEYPIAELNPDLSIIGSKVNSVTSIRVGPKTAAAIKALGEECQIQVMEKKKSDVQKAFETSTLMNTPAAMGHAKYNSAFGAVYSKGQIPCKLVHEFSSQKLSWLKDPKDMKSFDPLLISFFEGLTETNHPYTFFVTEGIKGMLASEGSYEKVLDILPKLTRPLRQGLSCKKKLPFKASLRALNQLTDLMGFEIIPVLSVLLSPVALKASNKLLKNEMMAALQGVERKFSDAPSLREMVFKIIKSKIPTYVS